VLHPVSLPPCLFQCSGDPLIVIPKGGCIKKPSSKVGTSIDRHDDLLGTKVTMGIISLRPDGPLENVFSKLNLHAFRDAVLPVLGPQCIITTGRRRWLLVVVGDEYGREGMGVANSKRSVYCVVRFHCLATVPQFVCAV